MSHRPRTTRPAGRDPVHAPAVDHHVGRHDDGCDLAEDQLQAGLEGSLQAAQDTGGGVADELQATGGRQDEDAPAEPARRFTGDADPARSEGRRQRAQCSRDQGETERDHRARTE
jgi:hypothetical protein